MKTFNWKAIFASVLLIGFIISSPASLFSQTNTNNSVYVSFAYMKSKNNDYEKVEKEIWKPFMQRSVNEGKILWWGIYNLQYPNGTNSEYDYVAINVYSSLTQMEEMWEGMEARMKKIHPKKDIAKLLKRTNESRDLVWQEIFLEEARAVPTFRGAGKYIMINRMQSNPGKYNDYVKMETELFMPVHQIQARTNAMEDWTFLSRRLPYGDEYGYNFITVDFYASMKQLETPIPDSSWKKAHPNKNLDAVFRDFSPNDLRTMVRGELWKSVTWTITKK